MTVPRMVGMMCLALFVGIPCVSEPVRAAAIDLTQIDFEYDSSAWTLGWRFSVTAPTSVEALGVYDSGQDGLAGPAQVGLWLASGGAPLVQTAVAAGTAAQLDGHFRFTPIASTALTPGLEYIVGSHLDGDLATALFGGNGLVDPRVSVIDVRYSSIGSGFGFPDVTDPGTDGAAFLGGNFQLTPVPLPAAVWLFGSGVAGLVGLARRRSSK
ncbi:MAG: VPLPA-CTERM sorting domain-containing protein [Nitrospira sp.]|nr:MAG: VPLPA-CTERM sorting domain-containing protein [Nitrospira sp.]